MRCSHKVANAVGYLVEGFFDETNELLNVVGNFLFRYIFATQKTLE